MPSVPEFIDMTVILLGKKDRWQHKTLRGKVIFELPLKNCVFLFTHIIYGLLMIIDWIIMIIIFRVILYYIGTSQQQAGHKIWKRNTIWNTHTPTVV